MPPTLPPWVTMLLAFFKLTPLEPIASEIEKDIADGKISVVEAAQIEQIVAQKVAELYPAGNPEAVLAQETGAAFAKYWRTRHPEDAGGVPPKK